MIALTNDVTKFPVIDKAVIVNDLESWTGADLLISGLDMPCSKLALVKEHIEAGAIIVQVKIGLDLAASVGYRLSDSLIRMREIAPRQAQRILLFVGTLACDHDGKAIIDGRNVEENVPGVNFWAVQSSLDAWSERGGTVIQLSRLSLLNEWVQRKETRLKKYLTDPIEYFYPEKPSLIENDLDMASDPLQIPIKITDGRVPLSYLIGPVKAQKMYIACKGDIAQAFEHLSNPEDWPYLPKGVFKSDAEKFVERMGLNGRIMQVRQPYSKGDDY